jgi:hypothetical protein
MQRRIPRSALVITCVAALAAFAAGSAQAAITAVTGPATKVTATTAMLSGAVTTGGVLTQWQFAYTLAGNPFVGSETTGGLIPAGTTAPTAVFDTATNLTPSTAYTFQVIADNATYGSTYYLLSPIYGGLQSFTTTGPGSASLASTKLKVKFGHVLFGIKCTKALACDGGVAAIVTKHKGKKVSCGSAAFNVPAGTTKKLTTSKVSAKCKALLVLATKHKISAKLTAGFTYQKGFTKSVTLTTAK